MEPNLKDINLEIEIKNLKELNTSLKEKLDSIRANNNSFIYTALCKTQAELPIIPKNTTTYGKQKYADLAEVIRMSRPILTKNGLSVSQIFNVIDGKIHLKTILCHTSGQYIESNIRLIMPNLENKNINVLHEIGKAITYLRRYTYSAIVGIATDEDTDGN